MFTVLDVKQKKRLQDPYIYECQNSTLLDPLMQVFWRWLVNKIPFWISPCTLTCSGIAFNIATTILLLWYCPKAVEEASNFGVIICFLIFNFTNSFINMNVLLIRYSETECFFENIFIIHLSRWVDLWLLVFTNVAFDAFSKYLLILWRLMNTDLRLISYNCL